MDSRRGEVGKREGQRFSNHATSIHVGEIEEDDDQRTPNRHVVAGEREVAGLAAHLEDGELSPR